MSALGRRLLQRLATARLRRALRFQEDPAGAQAALLGGLLRKAAATEWGRRYGFGRIAAASDVIGAYRREVPLHTREDLRHDVARILDGAEDVIWPGRFRYFGETSGTASGGLLLPVSDDRVAAQGRLGRAVILGYLRETGDASLLRGRILAVPAFVRDDPVRGALIGSISGIRTRLAPAWFHRRFSAVPEEVSLIEDWNERLDATVDYAVDRDVRFITMLPCFGPVMLRRAIERYNEKYGASVTTAGEIWPNLRLFLSGGMALAPYRHAIEALMGLPGLQFRENYAATEGGLAFQASGDHPALTLHLDNGNFYEFVPVEEAGRPDARRFSVREVEPDVKYAVYLTTNSGLWTYPLGDVVRFTSVRPHELVVVGRVTEQLRRNGEAVDGEEGRKALQHACEATGARAVEYHVTSRGGDANVRPRHQWLIEFDQDPPEPAALAARLDERLSALNTYYRILRTTEAFAPPEVVPLPPGTFLAWLRRERGRVDAQSKVPNMSDDPTMADALLELAREGSPAGAPAGG